MPQFAQVKPPRQVTPFYISDIYLDIEVLADHFEAVQEMFSLDDEAAEEPFDNGGEDETADDLLF